VATLQPVFHPWKDGKITQHEIKRVQWVGKHNNNHVWQAVTALSRSQCACHSSAMWKHPVSVHLNFGALQAN